MKRNLMTSRVCVLGVGACALFFGAWAVAPDLVAETGKCESMAAAYKEIDREIQRLDIHATAEDKVNQLSVIYAGVSMHRQTQQLIVQLMTQEKCPMTLDAPKWTHAGNMLSETSASAQGTSDVRTTPNPRR